MSTVDSSPVNVHNLLCVIEALTWMELRPLGEAPPRTYGHTITTCRLKGILCMLVFAGRKEMHGDTKKRGCKAFAWGINISSGLLLTGLS